MQIIRTKPQRLIEWKTRLRLKLTGTSPTGATHYREAEYQRPVLLLAGGERKGLTPKLMQGCDEVIKLPMNGRSDSLNLAVPTGVLLYEILNHHEKHLKAG